MIAGKHDGNSDKTFELEFVCRIDQGSGSDRTDNFSITKIMTVAVAVAVTETMTVKVTVTKQ